MTVISLGLPAVIALFAVAVILVPVAFLIKKFNFIPAVITAADIIALLLVCLIFSVPATEIIFMLFAIAAECLVFGAAGGKK